MNKQQLAAKIWESANRMRSKIEANEYKDYILGFIFYKYLSETEVRWVISQGAELEELPDILTESDASSVKSIQQNIGYFISYDNLFSTWIDKGNDFNVSDVRDALSAFSRLISPTHKKVFDRILDTLQTGLSKLGDSAGTQTRAISDLIHLIKDIPMDGKQGYDVLGFIYEYLIGMFAANAGKKAGEFYTPHEVSLLMSEIVAHHVRDRREIKIYDPTSGSGSLLINIGKAVAKHIPTENSIKYYAQELKENTYNLTRMNLVMRGILPDNITTRNGDTLEEDWPYFEESDPVGTYDPLFVDAVVSNPPYSQPWDPTHKEADPRFAEYGMAPRTKADFAFLLHDLYHLKPDGIMTIVLPHGVLFRGGEEGSIRKNLIERNHVDAIIGLPSNIFFGTGIPTIIMVLKKTRSTNDVLIIDASQRFKKEGKNNVLQASDIKIIVDTVVNRTDVEKLARVVPQKEIRDNEYNLNIPRYVNSSDAPETWDVYASMFGGIPEAEVALFDEHWKALPGLKESLFVSRGTPYLTLANEDIDKTITTHKAVADWTHTYNQTLSDVPSWLNAELLGDWTGINVTREESSIAEAIFARLAKLPLIDQYNVYQKFYDEWSMVAIDREIIQTEGFAATKVVDPNMVTKKKNGRDQEVQEGWVGRIIPFELVQKTLLAEEATAVTKLQDRLAEISAEYETLLDSFTDEEKKGDFLNDASDAFIPAAVDKAVKSLLGTPAQAKKAVLDCEQGSFETKIYAVQALIKEESALKKSVKAEEAKLQLLTKAAIESLSDEQATVLLEQKWISPLTEALAEVPDAVINELVVSVRALAAKYASTYADVAGEIVETQETLASLIDGLTGSDFDMLGLGEFATLLRGDSHA